MPPGLLQRDEWGVFGLSFWEIAIILVVALVIFGPKKLPDLARGLGKGIREFRKATEDFKSTMDTEMHRPDPAPPKALPATKTEALPEAHAEPVEAPSDTVERKPGTPVT